MLRGLFSRYLDGPEPVRQRAIRPRLYSPSMPSVIYVIGDVHGCYDLLVRLEEAIVDDAGDIEGERWIVGLGDYIDRGPASAKVVDHLLSAPPAGFRRICLAGNHEQIAFDFLCNGEHDNGWLEFGGRQSLASYGLNTLPTDPERLVEQLEHHIPEAHLNFLGTRPALLAVPGYCFVHAGIDPALSLDAQTDEVLLWSRPAQFIWPDANIGLRVIHGHTPVGMLDLSRERVNIDLGAYATGRLAAIRIKPNEELQSIVIGPGDARISTRMPGPSKDA